LLFPVPLKVSDGALIGNAFDRAVVSVTFAGAMTVTAPALPPRDVAIEPGEPAGRVAEAVSGAACAGAVME
jgi:hypothetical protein